MKQKTYIVSEHRELEGLTSPTFFIEACNMQEAAVKYARNRSANMLYIREVSEQTAVQISREEFITPTILTRRGE